VSREREDDIRVQLNLPARRSREERGLPNAVNQLKRALRDLRGRKSGVSRSSVQSRGFVRSAPEAYKRNQRVAVRINYSLNKGAGRWRAHGRYLEREGAQNQAAKGLGFGSDGVEVAISQTLQRWEDAKDPHLFKFILSPEFGERVDLKTHTQHLVHQMEKDLGTKLEWVAIDHHNTDNPHVHLVIRGLDDSGKALQLSRDYIKLGVRQRAGELATKELGYRTEKDIKEARERQIPQQRFTDLDRTLQSRSKDSEVSFENAIPKALEAREHRLALIRRLTHLTAMGLAEKTGNKSWKLSPNLESALRQTQIATDRLKTIHNHRHLLSDPNLPMVTTELKTLGQRLSGRVLGSGLNEGTGRAYTLIEGVDGQLHYVTQTSSMEAKRGTGLLKAGTLVTMETTTSKKGFTFVKIQDYGRKIGTDFIDSLLLSGELDAPVKGESKTFTGKVQSLAQKRREKLILCGAVKELNGTLTSGNALAYDLIRYRDQSINSPMFSTDKAIPAIYRVVAKGQSSIIVQTIDGNRLCLTDRDLASLKTERKYMKVGSEMFLGVNKAGVRLAHLNIEKLNSKIQDEKINLIDIIGRQLGEKIQSHPINEIVQKRSQAWKDRGIEFTSKFFQNDAFTWIEVQAAKKEIDAEGPENAARNIALRSGKRFKDAEIHRLHSLVGKVLAVRIETNGSTILLTSKSEITLIKTSHKPLVKEGDYAKASVGWTRDAHGKASKCWIVHGNKKKQEKDRTI
jgi:type IV secretory pathway VirD2 relaxase